MSFELSVNLEYMFHEAGERLEDRMAAAAAAGFTKVEIFTTGNRDVPSLKAALGASGCQLISVVTDPRHRLIERDTHEAFREMFRIAAQEAVELGCRNLVVPSGPAVPYMRRPMQLEIVAEAMASLLPIAEELDVTILLEPVNTRHDHPGVLFSMTEDAVKVAEMVNSPRVRLLYDMYHSITEGEDPTVILPAVAQWLGHVQIADAPGRGEPGSAKVDWPAMLRLIASVGYTGPIGIECSPTRPTAEALAYIQQLCA
ncbi:TIM barrel protein [Novosphingobium sp. FSY-8]|uniref:TIM barrel protein n=1 Tax=Novosphingobium ovatum TaxID=1908523 RepID=A0ABW9XD00_9SPHN|nr:TIM barrel protein [Novosphingobium ovatum]NBC36416.1 TIM barrel protein [Novosphingobium ovatum]